MSEISEIALTSYTSNSTNKFVLFSYYFTGPTNKLVFTRIETLVEGEGEIENGITAETTYPGDLDHCILAIKFRLASAYDFLATMCFFVGRDGKKRLFYHQFRITKQVNWEGKEDLTECLKDAIYELEG